MSAEIQWSDDIDESELWSFEERRFHVDGVEFVSTLEHRSKFPGFCIKKQPALVEATATLLREFEGGNIVELGISQGGSTARGAGRQPSQAHRGRAERRAHRGAAGPARRDRRERTRAHLLRCGSSRSCAARADPRRRVRLRAARSRDRRRVAPARTHTRIVRSAVPSAPARWPLRHRGLELATPPGPSVPGCDRHPGLRDAGRVPASPSRRARRRELTRARGVHRLDGPAGVGDADQLARHGRQGSLDHARHRAALRARAGPTTSSADWTSSTSGWWCTADPPTSIRQPSASTTSRTTISGSWLARCDDHDSSERVRSTSIVICATSASTESNLSSSRSRSTNCTRADSPYRSPSKSSRCASSNERIGVLVERGAPPKRHRGGSELAVGT